MVEGRRGAGCKRGGGVLGGGAWGGVGWLVMRMTMMIPFFLFVDSPFVGCVCVYVLGKCWGDEVALVCLLSGVWGKGPQHRERITHTSLLLSTKHAAPVTRMHTRPTLYRVSRHPVFYSPLTPNNGANKRLPTPQTPRQTSQPNNTTHTNPSKSPQL